MENAPFIACVCLVYIAKKVNVDSSDHAFLTSVGSLEHCLCEPSEALAIGDFIYLSCEGSHGRFRLHERLPPFQLMALILADGISNLMEQSVYSQATRSIYVLESYYPQRISRISLDTLQVRRVLYYYGGRTSRMAVSSDGSIYLLTVNTETESTFLDIYTPKAKHVRRIQANFLYTQAPPAFQILDQYIILSHAGYRSSKRESWVGFWKIDKLEEGEREGQFVWKSSLRPKNKTYAFGGRRAWKRVAEISDVVNFHFDACGGRMFVSMTTLDYLVEEWRPKPIDGQSEFAVVYPCSNVFKCCHKQLRITVPESHRSYLGHRMLYDDSYNYLILFSSGQNKPVLVHVVN